MNRRIAICASVLANSVALAACGGTDSAGGNGGNDAGGDVLRVGMYGGTWTDAVKATAAKKFTEEAGAKVEYIEGNPSDLAAQIYATSAQGVEPAMDVIETDDQTQSQLVQRELLVPTAEYEDAVPDVFGEVTTPPANEGYAPAHCDWYLTMVYNAEAFEQRGLPDPTSWADLFQPELAGHVAIPDISTAMGIPTIFAVNGGTDDWDGGIEKLSELDTYSVYSSSSDMQADFANGNVWAAAAADGRGWQLVDDDKRFRALHASVPGTDKLGPQAGSCYLDVVKGSENTELAAEFIKASYADSVQVEFAKQSGYIPSSKSAVKILIDEEPIWKGRIPEPDSAAVIEWPSIVPEIPEVVDEFNRQFGQ